MFLITGATSGIGLETARGLARRGAQLYIAARAGRKGEVAVAQLRRESGGAPIERLQIDLADLSTVRACAAEFLSRGCRLDGIVNNAAVAGRRGVTRDGFELAFGVNHLGHFLLTALLLDRLRESAPSRVVTLASDAHFWVKGIDFEALRRAGSLTGVPEYCVSKLCNVLFTRELARRLAGTGVTTYAVHPGAVATQIWGRMPRPLGWMAERLLRTSADGASTAISCATAPVLATSSGQYHEPRGRSEPSTAARDDLLAVRLWTESERFVTGALTVTPVAAAGLNPVPRASSTSVAP